MTDTEQFQSSTLSNHALSDALISEAIALAWADDVSFETIKEKLGLTEPEIIRLMRGSLKPSSFRLWRKRVSGRKAKHKMLLRGKETKLSLNDAQLIDDDDTIVS
jgi:uncharacterized protein (TIGR03643 family)